MYTARGHLVVVVICLINEYLLFSHTTSNCSFFSPTVVVRVGTSGRSTSRLAKWALQQGSVRVEREHARCTPMKPHNYNDSEKKSHVYKGRSVDLKSTV